MGIRLRSQIYLLTAAFGLVVISQWQIARVLKWPYPALNTLVVTDNYTGDLGALLLGTHRLAGDLGYIQFLQYYSESDKWEDEHGNNALEGAFPELLTFGERIAHLDPYFNGPILEIAGALAFNLKRFDQSLSLLKNAIVMDPTYYRYRIYAAAILFKNNQKDKELVEILKQAIQYPDCPILFQNVLANLLHKEGDDLGAVRIYLKIMQTSAGRGDRDVAQKKIQEILEAKPELSGVVQAEASR